MSTADENAKIVRRGYQAFNAGDIATLTELFEEKATWHTQGRGPMGGDRHGREAVLAFFGRYGSETGGTFKAALEDVLPGDDGRVVAVHRNIADRKGKHLDANCCIEFQVKGGRIASGRHYIYDLHDWDAFWA